MPELELERTLEAILMVAEEPQSLVSLATALGVPIPAVRQSIERLVADYDGTDDTPRRGFELREVGGGWRIYVRPEYDELVRTFVLTQSPTRLSQAALETLAVIAYRQPITRADLEVIRGVQCAEMLKMLMDRGLVRIGGEDDSLGRPFLYETTRKFLEIFGLRSLDELPMGDQLRKPKSQVATTGDADEEASTSAA